MTMASLELAHTREGPGSAWCARGVRFGSAHVPKSEQRAASLLARFPFFVQGVPLQGGRAQPFFPVGCCDAFFSFFDPPCGEIQHDRREREGGVQSGVNVSCSTGRHLL